MTTADLFEDAALDDEPPAHAWSDADFDRDAHGNLREVSGVVLWNHGVWTVEAGVWCSVLGSGLVVYAPVAELRRRLALPDVEPRFTTRPGVPTGRGLCLTWDQFAGMPGARQHEIRHPPLLRLLEEARAGSRAEAGDAAERLVMVALQAGVLPTFHGVNRHASDVGRQLRGIDLTIRVSPVLDTWEVKYDGPGGPVERGGTGRLWFQTHTRNPPAGHAESWVPVR